MDFAKDQTTQDARVLRILEIVAREAGIDRALLRPDAGIDELGIGSLDMTQAVFQIETEFNIEIPVVTERAGAEFTTVGELVAQVLAVLDKARGAPVDGAD